MPTEAPTKITGDELLAELLGTPPKEEVRPEEAPEDEKDLDKLKQRTPPKNGICRRCGRNKPINRLMLCYPCWVKTNLEKDGWREGMPHPEHCECEGLKDHTRRASGN
ncbi:MAG TPA: hypothetical protein VNI01_01180 [Elusimicrobiota bacterium]|jgi:hypothetical protein|nr:hypothetical protein [Elusimicrobiota bacterium]